MIHITIIIALSEMPDGWQFHAPWESSMNRKGRPIFDPASLSEPFTEKEIMRERASCSFHPDTPL
jgi:hypothetical protein